MLPDHLNIRLSDESGQRAIDPTALDISDLRRVLSAVEDVLYPNGRKDSNETIALTGVSSGSVRLAVAAPPHAMASAATILQRASMGWGRNTLPSKAGLGIERLQKLARRLKYRVELSRPAPRVGELIQLIEITPQTAYYYATHKPHDQQTTLYGEVVDIGGEKPPKVKLRTEEYGILSIESNADLLKEPKDNVLYEVRAVVAEGAWDASEGTWKQLKMVRWEPYQTLSSVAIDGWLASLEPSGWDDVDVDEAIRELRA